MSSNQPDDFEKLLRASCILLDEDSAPTKDDENDEFYMRRDLQLARARVLAPGELEGTEGALLMLRFVRSVQRGYIPEKDVIKRVGAALEQVLKECTHHLDSELQDDLNNGRVSPGDERYKGKRLHPECFMMAQPDTSNEETGKALTKAFELHRPVRSKGAVAYANFLDTDERLAERIRADPRARLGKHFRKIVIENRKNEYLKAVDAEYMRLWGERHPSFERVTALIQDDDRQTLAHTEFNGRLMAEAKQAALNRVVPELDKRAFKQAVKKAATRLQNKYNRYVNDLPDEMLPTMAQDAKERSS